MGITLLKFTIAVATGLVGGFVQQNLGAQWGIAMLAGIGLGFWVSTLLE